MKVKFDILLAKHVVLFYVLIALFGLVFNQTVIAKNSVQTDLKKRLDLLKSQGADVSITFLPTTFGPKPNSRIGMVVGIMLENCGMNNLDFKELEFNPTNSLFQVASSEFSSFVAQNVFDTDYVFYSRFFIDNRTITEVWGIVANKKGEIVWTDRQTKDSPAVNNAEVKPQDPMTSCLFLTDRFRTQMGLGPMDDNAPDGTIAQLMNADSGLPSEKERALMEERALKFKKDFKKSNIVVYPALILENQINKECALNLAAMLNKKSLCSASVSDKSPILTFDKSKQGQDTMLWGIARSFQKTLKEDKLSADYALYAHYGFFADWNKVGFINFIVCDKNGNWVLTNLANSHHEDFQNTDWKTLADCDQFVVNRLEGYLK
jgi:hypothetical protein